MNSSVPETKPTVEPEVSKALDSAAEDAEMPLPSDPKTVFLGGLFLLAVLAASFVAREVILPVVLAFILKLLLQPVMRLLARLRVPRVLASLLMILALFGIIAGLGSALSGPAANWAKRLPEGLPRLQERVKVISGPLDSLKGMLAHARGMVGAGDEGHPAQPAQPASAGTADIQSAILSGVQTFTSEFLTTFLVLFFLLNSGDTFLRRLVEVMPRFKDKRQVIDISQQVESDVSSYLVTITVMNAAVGVATGLAMWALGLPDAALWGAVAFLLNYVPILGPLVGVVTFLGVGMLSLDPLWKAFMPMILYGAIHVIEGETITPMLLARRFTLNPVLVIISLLFWDWMWGVPGAILAVPMLAITKIVCDRIRPLAAFGHFLEGEKHGISP
ncbi:MULTISPECIES: AI-2E family transporter [Luteibacter]|uniref:AI-2E family transporter n=1 Tax=Luteibacter TaxID=242605 RepID=UPI0009DE2978|nr:MULTISPECIES: AI-2E family transporter [unclassified Luteibacter]MDR6640999.1 putative PurR-regulated permease PerM [Luteibacter sp. 1214]